MRETTSSGRRWPATALASRRTRTTTTTTTTSTPIATATTAAVVAAAAGATLANMAGVLSQLEANSCSHDLRPRGHRGRQPKSPKLLLNVLREAVPELNDALAFSNGARHHEELLELAHVFLDSRRPLLLALQSVVHLHREVRGEAEVKQRLEEPLE